jgi:hypothetical protein
MPEDALERIV